MDGDFLGEAADRLADDLNERFGAGISRADRLFLEQVLIDAVDDAGTIAMAFGHHPGDYEEWEDHGFHLFNLWFRNPRLVNLVANRLKRNAELGVMIGHRPPEQPPGVEEGLRTGIARAVYDALIGGPATEDSRLMEEADRYLQELIDEFGEPTPEDLVRAKAFVEGIRKAPTAEQSRD